MQEKKRKDKEATGGGGSIFGAGPGSPDNKVVHVSSGPYAEELPVAGMTIAEVRHKFSTQLDIDPNAQSVINGNTVDDESYKLNAGESLSFIRHAGEKGAKVVIEGNQAVDQESGTAVPITVLANRMGANRISTRGVVLPAGTKAVLSRGNIVVLVWERCPNITRLSWIRPDSPQPYGTGATYQFVRIALPYLVIMGVFAVDGKGMPWLLCKDECFFRNEPIRSLDDELLFPGLLNCSKFNPQEGNPLSWICTQYLKRNKGMSSKDPGVRLCASFEAVRYCLLETSFNLSSEHHEGNSWYGASHGVDPRIHPIENWVAETQKDPLFVLSVPWLKTGHSVKQAVERIFKNHGAVDGEISNAEDVSRIICNAR